MLIEQKTNSELTNALDQEYLRFNKQIKISPALKCL